MTTRERALLQNAVDALEAGDSAYAVELVLVALDDEPVVDDSRCACGLWPGQAWNCVCKAVTA